MKRRAVLVMLGMLPLFGCAQTQSTQASLASGATGSLMSMLSSQLGVTENQARGGVGAYLTLLQEKLVKGDFDKIAALVPGASGYMETAKKLGAVAGPLMNSAGLNSSLGKLGMNAETIAKFTPTVTNYLGKMGGSSVQQMLAGVLK